MTQRHGALIGGKRLDLPETVVDLDPASGQPLAEVARCGPDEVDEAVAAARTAFEGTWRRTPPVDRSRVLRRLSELITRDAEQLARMETSDTGKPLKQAHTDVAAAARYFEFYADTLQTLYGDTIPGRIDLFSYTMHEPYGVTGHIIPWNYPLQIGARSVAPALAAGNCCVLKPAEEAPLTVLRIGELALEAGLPAGALNVVPGLGEEAGAALSGHPGIDHLAFTGSLEVGTLVAKAAAEHVVPVTLELGGKSPNVVFADADLAEAVPVIVASIMQNAGQTCSAGSRLLVQESVHEVVVDAVAERFRGVRIGPGLDDPDLGPLITAEQRQRVTEKVDRARDEARLVVGGGIPGDDALRGGFFFEPTLFDGVAADAALAQEEVFGPVLAVSVFSDDDDAIRLANSTDYGLIAAVWSRDVGRAHELAHEIRAGQVYVNNYGAGGGIELPFGGWKRSGYGREKGFEALRSYTQTKTVAVQLGRS